MSDTDDEMKIDFGDPELNDPNYEQKVDEQTEGTTDGETTQQTTDGAQEQSGTDGAASQQPKAAEQDGAQAGKGGATDSTGQPQQQQPQGRARADKDGNLLDGQGNIIAKAGPERRAFERVQAQDRHIRGLEGEIQKRDAQIAQLQALNDAPQKLGLDAQEVQMGMQAMVSFKKDPVATARWMLQETMRLGYDLPSIIGKDANGQIAGGTLDLNAVKSMISDAVSPLVQDREAQQVSQQSHADAQREYDRFMANHDHASVHESAIASLVQQDRNTTPEVAYWRLREYAAANGLDFAKPLGPQVQARQQGGQQQQARAPNGNATPQAQALQQQPMPNGSAPPAGDMQQRPAMANADDAWDSIVNDSLREAGFMN